MISCDIRAAGSDYRAHVGRGLLGDFLSLLPAGYREKSCAVICDTNSRRFADEIANLFAPGTLITLPAGESSKSLAEVSTVCDQMLAARLDRSAFVIGVGGGVVGDLSGFAAAIFQRGIPWVNVPTTLLAMVDSSIGGKTGVNASAGKNLIGAIHHPSLVIADVDTLATLPPREFKQGFAEIIKHGIIRDAGMLDELEQAPSSRAERSAVEGPCGSTVRGAAGFLDFARNDLEQLIGRNIRIKAAIVAEDDHDVTGARAVLNFGHTVGHAIERAVGYGTLLHGEAISLGIVAACRVSVKTAGLSAVAAEEVVALLRAFDLPTALPPEIDRERILEALRFDKKFEQGRVRFVVTPRLGEAYLSSEVTLGDIEATIAQL